MGRGPGHGQGHVTRVSPERQFLLHLGPKIFDFDFSDPSIGKSTPFLAEMILFLFPSDCWLSRYRRRKLT